MKQKEWLTPNRMLFESDHKEFNRQVDCISTGNVIGSVQTSFYVRSKMDTECNEQQFPVGHLRQVDLSLWRRLGGLPPDVLQYVREVTEEDEIIVYRFFHYSGAKRIVHGYIVTTPSDAPLRFFVTGPTVKSESVIYEAAKYVCADS